MMPSLVSNLQKKGIETTPYVNAFAVTPDKGFAQYFEVHDMQRVTLLYLIQLGL